MILEFFVRLLYGVMRLFIWALGLAMSATWLSRHFEAMRQIGFWLALGTATYLVFGIMRGTIPALASPSLSFAYQWPWVVGALIVLMFGLALRELDEANYTSRNTRHAFEPDRPAPPQQAGPPQQTGPIQTTPTLHSAGIVAAIVLAALVLGTISTVTSARHEATLAEKLCAQANARISDSVDQRVRDGAGLFDRVFGTQTQAKIPCADR